MNASVCRPFPYGERGKAKQASRISSPLGHLNGGVIECKPAAGPSGRKPQRFTPYGHYLQGACAGSQGGGQRDLRKLKSSICPHPIRLAQIRHTVVNVLYKCHLWAHSRRGTTKLWGTGLEKFSVIHREKERE
jgi:hypothetical protein